jgi:hypothetical protein
MVLTGYCWYSRAAMGVHKYPASDLKEALDAAHGWMHTASPPGLERCCEAMQGVFWVLHRPHGYSSGTADMCAHGQPHQAEGGPSLRTTISKTHSLTDVHTCGATSVTANAVQPSRPPERQPRRMRRTVLPRGPCGGPDQRAALDRLRPSIGCGLRGHGGSAQPRPWQAH